MATQSGILARSRLAGGGGLDVPEVSELVTMAAEKEAYFTFLARQNGVDEVMNTRFDWPERTLEYIDQEGFEDGGTLEYYTPDQTNRMANITQRISLNVFTSYEVNLVDQYLSLIHI